MKHIVFTSITATGLFLGCFLFAGCGGEPFVYSPSSEIKPGPGLFSGPDGEFILVGPAEDEAEKLDQDTSRPKE